MPTFEFEGSKVAYRSQGNREDPVLLILPGNTASSAHHNEELAFFHALGFHAIAIDFPGTGQSDRLPRPWPVDWFERNAAACAILLDSLNTKQAIICGTSGGAIVALWMAILFPERVQAVIADSEAIRLTSDNFRAIAADRAQRHPGQIHFWSDGHGADFQAVVDADTELFTTIETERAQNGIWEIHAGRLCEIRCPVLITCAINDDLVPGVGPQMLEMAAQIPDSRFYAKHQGWHPFMWSCREDFQIAAKSFLTNLHFA